MDSTETYTVNDKSDVFIYKPMYSSDGIQSRWNRLLENINEKAIRLILQTRLTKGLRSITDTSITGNQISLHNDMVNDWKPPLEKLYPFSNIRTLHVHFFEAIEIDTFEKHEKQFMELQGKFSTYPEKNVKDIKSSFGIVTMSGSYRTLKIRKGLKKKLRLIESIAVAQTKSKENYFILDFQVTPSKSYHSYFQKIVQSPIGNEWKNEFINIFNFLKGRYIVKSSRLFNIRQGGLNLLYSDLQYEINLIIQSHFPGLFASTHSKNRYPSLHTLVTESIEETLKDIDLEKFLGRNDRLSFVTDDASIRISMFEKEFARSMVLYENRDYWKTLDMPIDPYQYLCFNRAIAVPAVLSGILKNKKEQLTAIKRRTYDYLNIAFNSDFIWSLINLKQHSQVFRIHEEFARIKVFISRFRNDFGTGNEPLYTLESNLHRFKQEVTGAEPLVLSKVIFNPIKTELKQLEDEVSRVSAEFDTIDTVNTHKASLSIQSASFIVAIVTPIFGFSTIKEVVLWLFSVVKTFFIWLYQLI